MRFAVYQTAVGMALFQLLRLFPANYRSTIASFSLTQLVCGHSKNEISDTKMLLI
jgi:hypothetical protein